MAKKLVDRPQTIIELQTRNVKKIRALTITPDGELVVIGGNNGEGKTSTLDSILYAFRGKRSMPEGVVRDGTTEAEISVTTQDLEIRRVVGEDGKVKLELRKDGVRVKTSAQTALDDLTRGISFDPEEFSRLSSREQGEHLRRLINLDLGDLDDSRSRAFEDRTDANRELSKKKARLDSMEFHPGLPEREQSVGDLVSKLEEIRKHNRTRDVQVRELEDLRVGRDRTVEKLEQWDRDLDVLKKKITDGEKELENIGRIGKELKAKVDQFEPKSETEVTDSMKNIEETNRRIRGNMDRGKLEVEVKKLHDRSEALTATISSTDEERTRRLSSVDMPVEGLALNESGAVTFNGIVLSECSGAEKLRVAVSIALRSNPDLPVMLIRDGSLLDRTSLKMVAEMAQEANAQVWIERVTDDKDEAIIIEDGAIKSQPEKKGQGSFNV